MCGCYKLITNTASSSSFDSLQNHHKKVIVNEKLKRNDEPEGTKKNGNR